MRWNSNEEDKEAVEHKVVKQNRIDQRETITYNNCYEKRKETELQIKNKKHKNHVHQWNKKHGTGWKEKTTFTWRNENMKKNNTKHNNKIDE